MHLTIYSLIAITLITILNTWLWYSMYKKMLCINQKCNDLTSRCDALSGHIQMLDRSFSDFTHKLVHRVEKMELQCHDFEIRDEFSEADVYSLQDEISQLQSDVKFFSPLTTLATKYSIKEQIVENTKKLNELKAKLKEIERELK